MKKVVVFGKPGSGKSTLCVDLSIATGIPLHSLDSILYERSGDLVERKVYDNLHDEILASDFWIIDGFDRMETFNKRVNMADTLIYIDLPYYVSYYLVTKRCFKGLVHKPEGWPEGCSILKGTLASYKTLRLCPKFWNADFLRRIKSVSNKKSLYVIRTVAELNNFVDRHVRVNHKADIS